MKLLNQTKLNPRGFSHFMLLLFVAVIATVAAAGLVVYDNHNKSSTANASGWTKLTLTVQPQAVTALACTNTRTGVLAVMKFIIVRSPGYEWYGPTLVYDNPPSSKQSQYTYPTFNNNFQTFSEIYNPKGGNVQVLEEHISTSPDYNYPFIFKAPNGSTNLKAKDVDLCPAGA